MNIKQLKANIADLPDDMEVTVSLSENAMKALMVTENPLHIGPTYQTVKSLLISPVPLTGFMITMAMKATPGGTSPSTILYSLLTLRHTVNQTVAQITAPHNKRIAECEKQLAAHATQYAYLRSNPWWKRMWLALKNDYAENNG